MKQPVKVIEIKENWEFKVENDTIFKPAKVPGYVHLDLLDNGIIDSLYWGINPKKYNYVGDTSWVYRAVFQIDNKHIQYKKKFIQFEGIDTYADIYLNDSLLLTTDNMFLLYEADVSSLLKVGENELLVIFKSPIKEAKKIIAQYPFYTPAHAMADANDFKKFSRKAQYQFGWDWACPLIPTGIYRPVNLILTNDYRITDVYVQQKIVQDTAFISTQIELQAFNDIIVDIEVLVDGRSMNVSNNVELKNGQNISAISFAIENPELWWPNGLGKQHLYQIEVNILEKGRIITSKKQKLGIRTIEFVNEYDEYGKSYYFKVNGEPVFMKGVNYVPIDAMIPLVTKERYEKMLQNCVDANMNMVRVWGGGIYENDIFYDLCDEYGLLVYQDFMFASQMPPADSVFLAKVEKEAIYQVKRLRNHASMALWAGGNETESAWFEGFMPKEYPQEVYFVDHKKLFDTLLPRIVHKYHPDISYVRSSPTTGTDSIRVNTPGYGDTHAWDVWFGKVDFDQAKYNRLSRFISEYGFVGYPAYTSMKKYIPADHMDTASVVFQFRDAYVGIQDIINDFISRYYPQPGNIQELSYISGLLQAEAMRVSNEIYRRSKPFCMGALLWQLNDVWPVASWAMVDYYGQWKPIMYRTKESFAPVIVSMEQNNDTIYFYGINDYLYEITGELVIEVSDFDGNKIFSKHASISIDKNQSRILSQIAVKELTQGYELNNLVLKAELFHDNMLLATNLHYFKRFKDLNLPETKIEYKFINEDDKTFLEIKSQKLAKNIYLIDDKGEIHFSNNYFDLLPGESVRIGINSDISMKNLNGRFSIFTLNDMMKQKH